MRTCPTRLWHSTSSFRSRSGARRRTTLASSAHAINGSRFAHSSAWMTSVNQALFPFTNHIYFAIFKSSPTNRCEGECATKAHRILEIGGNMSSVVLLEKPVGSAEASLGKFIPGVDLKTVRCMGGDDFYMIVAGVKQKLRDAINPEQIIKLNLEGRHDEVSHRAQRCLDFDSLLHEFKSEQ